MLLRRHSMASRAGVKGATAVAHFAVRHALEVGQLGPQPLILLLPLAQLASRGLALLCNESGGVAADGMVIHLAAAAAAALTCSTQVMRRCH
jgi:hypothetical protein